MRYLYKIITSGGSKIEMSITARSKKFADKKIAKIFKDVGKYKIARIQTILDNVVENNLDQTL